LKKWTIPKQKGGKGGGRLGGSEYGVIWGLATIVHLTRILKKTL